MDKKELEILLSKLKTFEKPKVELEQYETPSNIISYIVFNAYLRKEIENKIVADLCCGTGKIAIALSLFNPKFVLAIDIDKDAIKIAKENYEIVKPKSKIYFIVANVLELKLNELIDLAIINAPFGMQSKYKDVYFLDFLKNYVKKFYFIHPESEKTRKFLINEYKKRNFEIIEIKVFDFLIKRIFEFHEKDKKYIKVAVYYAKNLSLF